MLQQRCNTHDFTKQVLLQRTATHLILQNTAIHTGALDITLMAHPIDAAATHCNTPHHTATHIILQHTKTHTQAQ